MKDIIKNKVIKQAISLGFATKIENRNLLTFEDARPAFARLISKRLWYEDLFIANDSTSRSQARKIKARFSFK